VSPWTDAEAREYLALKERLIALDRAGTDYSKYARDAEGFICGVLGEKLTKDLSLVCTSLVENQITLAKSGNGTGKTFIESRAAMWFYRCQKEPQVICAASPPITNLETILWGEIQDVTNKFPHLIADSRQRHLVICRNGREQREYIMGMAIPKTGTAKQQEAAFSGHHPKSLLYLFDEGDNIPDPVFDGADTCMSGGFTRMLIAYNPRERRGKVYRMFKSGEAHVINLSAFNHPSVIDGIDYWPGSVNREKTLERMALRSRPVADGEPIDKICYKVPDFLVGCVPKDGNGREFEPIAPGYRKITDHSFSHVVLGEYPAQAENQLISEEWTDKARSRYDLFVAKHGVIVPEQVRCTVGVDIADGGADSSVECKRFGNFVHPLVSWQKQDVIEVGDLVQADLIVHGIVNLAAIYCDGTGVGAGTAPYLVKTYSLPAVKVMVAWAATDKTDLGEFGILLDQLMWEVREWLRSDLAMLPPDAELIEELLAFTYEVKGGKVKVSSTDEVKDLLKRSPDRARALMFTFMRSGWFSEMDLS